MLHVIIRMIFRMQAYDQMTFTHFNIDPQRLAFLNWSPLSGLYPDKQISLSKTRLATSSTENIGSQIQVPTWWRHSALAKKPPHMCYTDAPGLSNFPHKTWTRLQWKKWIRNSSSGLMTSLSCRGEPVICVVQMHVGCLLFHTGIPTLTIVQILKISCETCARIRRVLRREGQRKLSVF